MKYVGLSDVRQIDQGSWKLIGITQETITWSISNQWTVPAEAFSKKALKYCERDPELVIVTE